MIVTFNASDNTKPITAKILSFVSIVFFIKIVLVHYNAYQLFHNMKNQFQNQQH